MRMLKLRKYLFDKENYLFVCGVMLFVGAGIINVENEKPILELSKQETALNINNNILVFLNAGNKRLLTDLLWVQTLIESDNEHYKKKDFNNWLFLRFSTISNLDPRFYENYLYGGQFLAIVKDDLEGASYIYDKGLGFYPEDYKLNFNAGFLNYYELGDFKKGLGFLEKIQSADEAPVFLRSIINKLRVATGVSLEEVFDLVLINYHSTLDETLKKKLRSDLYSIKSEIDLKCLNNQKNNCHHTDFEGRPYVKNGDMFFSERSFIPYKINKREANPLPSSDKLINFIK